MHQTRTSGILLHPTSLPGPFGIGDLGPEAYRFADFLADTGQGLWQVLPLGPTGYGNSPYMSFSAFGGNGMLVSPERLVEDGLLDASHLGRAPAFPAHRVDFPRAITFKMGLLRRSFDRFCSNFDLADLVRLDHFRGFEAYWEIPANEPTAINGRWVKGPGSGLFDVVRAALGDVRMVAEDLGVITPEVDALRDQLGYPGMRILQMAFGDDPRAGEYRPHGHIRNCAVYTATHDHNTTAGWFTAEPGTQTTQTADQVAREREFALKYAASDGREIYWDFIRLAMGSVARLAIFPLQDVLGLGSESRMNLPGTLRGNWEWRFTADAITPAVRQRLAELTHLYDRAA